MFLHSIKFLKSEQMDAVAQATGKKLEKALMKDRTLDPEIQPSAKTYGEGQTVPCTQPATLFFG